MGIFNRWFGGAKPSSTVTKTKSSSGSITVDMLGASGGMSSNQAMKIEAFNSCVRDKAESIGQIPLKLFRTKPDGKREIVKSGREHRIFTRKPCDYLTWQGFMEMVVSNIETRGAFYAYRVKNDRGNVMGIIPFRNQGNIRPAMDINGNIYYTYVTNDGKIKDPYAVEDLLIIKNFTLDGYTVLPPVVYMATLLGIVDSQEESYKELQENGITSQMALASENSFNDPEALKRLKDDWDSYRGPQGRKKIPILEQGLKPISLKLTPAELDLLKHREFSVDRICRMTRVPPHRVGMSSEGGAKGSITELDEMYMRNALNPILTKVESELNEMLPDNLHLEFNRKAFYAGSPWRLAEAVAMEGKSGYATINEGREDLGREPVEGGDVFVIDSNNLTFGKWDELPAVREQVNGRAQSGQTQQVENTEDE